MAQRRSACADSSIRCEPDLRGVLSVRAAFKLLNDINNKLDYIDSSGGVTYEAVSELQQQVAHSVSELSALTAPPPPP